MPKYQIGEWIRRYIEAMNRLQNILPDNLTYALGWTVVHSLWQGIIIAAIMALLLAILKDKTANRRFWIANVALLAMGISSAFTLFWLMDNQAETMENPQKMLILLRGGIESQSPENQSFINTISLFFNQHLGIIVLIWLIGVAFFALRLVGGLMYIEMLKTRHLTPLSNEWQSRMNMFKNRLGIQKTIALMESALVGVPMTIGWLKPMILLPIGTINGMSVAQVEAILAHELSHIQAKDYILNIFQTIIEILFYYHPAVWWISANIRAERENRCDDVAVKLCGNSLTYAKALLALQEMQHQNIRTYGLAMTFSTKRKGILLKRVKRILNQPQNRSNIMEKLAATGLLLVVIGTLAFADQPQNQNQTPKDKIEQLETPLTLSSSSRSGVTVSEDIFNEMTDTIPKRKGELSIKHEDNGKSVEMKMKDGEIMQLKINGQEIPKSDFNKYEDVTDDLIYNVPTPPTPPAPPSAPTPPTPPTPPSFFDAPTPPAPPTPPARPRLGIIKDKDKEGNTIIKLDKGDGKMSEIRMKDGEVYVDGEKLENRKDLTLKSPRFSGFEDFDFNFNFDNFMDLKGFKDFDKSFKGFIRNDSNLFFLNGDSLKLGTLDWDDSTDVFRLKNKLKYDFHFNNENSKRMRQDAKRMSEEARRFNRENGERIRRDAERIRQDAQRMAKEYSTENREKARKLRGDMHEKRDKWRAELESELQKDGILKENEKMKRFELDEDSLEINGKKMSKELRDKYSKIFEKHWGSDSKGRMHYNYRFDDSED